MSTAPLSSSWPYKRAVASSRRSEEAASRRRAVLPASSPGIPPDPERAALAVARGLDAPPDDADEVIRVLLSVVVVEHAALRARDASEAESTRDARRRSATGRGQGPARLAPGNCAGAGH